MKHKRFRMVSLMLTLLLAAALGVQPVPVAHAATITVDTTNDEFNTDGDCSLREAIHAANIDTAVSGCAAGDGADTITLPASIYTLTIPGTDEEASSTGDLDITGDLTINGAGQQITIIRAGTNSINGIDRVLDVHAGVTVEINDVEIRYGRSPDIDFEWHGGGIRNEGTLTLNNSRVTSNSAYLDGGGIHNDGTLTLNNSIVEYNIAHSGAGIYNEGTLTLDNSHVTSNSAERGGGGISNGGTLTLHNSTVSHNAAILNDSNGGGISNRGPLKLYNSALYSNSADKGGGISNSHTSLTLVNSALYSNSAEDGGGIRNFGPLALANCTVNGNQARGSGGGISNLWGTLTLFHTTIAFNWADSNNDGVGEGGGVAVYGGTINIMNTIIANNWDRGGDAHDCWGRLNSWGYNLLESGSRCTISGETTGNIIGLDPNLGVCGDHGGPTYTCNLQTGSPAIERIPNNTNVCFAGVSTDQRGYVRAGGPGNGGSACDIGAYEYDTVPLPPSTGMVYLPIISKNY